MSGSTAETLFREQAALDIKRNDIKCSISYLATLTSIWINNPHSICCQVKIRTDFQHSRYHQEYHNYSEVTLQIYSLVVKGLEEWVWTAPPNNFPGAVLCFGKISHQTEDKAGILSALRKTKRLSPSRQGDLTMLHLSLSQLENKLLTDISIWNTVHTNFKVRAMAVNVTILCWQPRRQRLWIISVPVCHEELLNMLLVVFSKHSAKNIYILLIIQQK